MTSSFQKVSKQKENQIRGTKVSVQNAQLLTSTGIPNLDYYLGGGIPLGTIFLVEEGSDTVYSNLIVKYFLAEGVACNHSIFLYSSEIASNDIIQTMPGISSDVKRVNQTEDEPMKIAWRYQDLPIKQSARGLGENSHSFCLSQPMEEQLLKECNILTYNISDSSPENVSPYDDLLAKLVPEIKRFSVKGTPNRNLLRIVINGVGSPLWGTNSASHSESILKFLNAIRCLARFSYAVFLITIPTVLYQELGCLNKIRLFVDFSIELEPLVKVEGQVNNAYKDYHGLFHVHKRSSINSVTPFVTNTSDLVFRATRKSFVIEKLHLPPDLSETVSRSTEDPKITKERLKNLACGAPSGLNKLDF